MKVILRSWLYVKFRGDLNVRSNIVLLMIMMVIIGLNDFISKLDERYLFCHGKENKVARKSIYPLNAPTWAVAQQGQAS